MDQVLVRRNGFLIFLFMILGCGTVLAQTGKHSTQAEASIGMQIEGKISVKGSGPHTYLCLSTDLGKDYRLSGELTELLRSRYQQERITLEGVVAKKALGPGFPAEFTIQKILTRVSP